MAGTTPPSLQGPTSKEKRYDRQLRLWAANGQQALEEAHVLLVNPSLTNTDEGQGKETLGTGVVGVEALKNLVLPGIGNYTIVDDATVSDEDLGVNFFLEEESLRKSRAGETCRLLQELNPDVNGNFISKSIETCLEDPKFLTPYNLILLIAPLSPLTLRKILLEAKTNSLPVFYIHSLGFYSSFSLQLPDTFPIVETHPDPASAQDLRLLSPWPELSKVAEQLKGLDDLPDHEHGHVPYILLLLCYLEKWKESHDGQPPSSYKDKLAFREAVRAGARTQNAEGGEENYDEAVGAVLKSINPPSLGINVRGMFELVDQGRATKDAANFWIVASAVKLFYEKHDALPLPGSVPDMKAQSGDYIKLQGVYKSKARRDVIEVADAVRRIEEQLKRETKVPDAEIEAFCKNAAHVRIVRGTGIPCHGEFLRSAEEKLGRKLRMNLEDEESLFPIWLSFYVFDLITSEKPGVYSATSLADPEVWESKIHEQLAFLYNSGPVPEEVLQRVLNAAKEMQRAGGGELHNIASLTGGMVAQEVIKVVTGQYVPVDGTCVFDGVGSRSGVLRMG